MSESEDDLNEISEIRVYDENHSRHSQQITRDFIAAVAIEDHYVLEKRKTVTTTSKCSCNSIRNGSLDEFLSIAAVLLFGLFALFLSAFLISFTSFHPHDDHASDQTDHQGQPCANLMHSQNAQFMMRYGGIALCISTVASFMLILKRKKELLYH